MKAFFLFITLLLCVAAFAADSIPNRKWTSIKGSSVVAKAHGVNKDSVILERENGAIVNVPIRMLIEADQELIRTHFGAKPEEKPDPKDPQDEEDDDNGPKALGDDKKIVQKDVNGSTIILPYELGSTNTGVEAERDLKINIYTPSTLRAGEKYAAMILVNPRHGSHQNMSAFIDAAEQNEMILVSLPKTEFSTRPHRDVAKNWPKYKVYVDEGKLAAYVQDPLDKLHKDFPIDTKRIYVAGFGDQSYLAMWAMNRIDAEGCLCLNGGGRGEFKASNRDALVMICAPGSKQRWDVATTFEESKGSSTSFLMFGSKNPGRSEISEGVMALNAMFLLRRQAGTHEFISERFEKEYMDFLEGLDLEEVTPWLEFTERFSLKDDKHSKRLKEIRKEIMKDPTAVKALEGYEDTLKVLMRYFSDGWIVSDDENGKKSTQNTINRVKEKYKGTMWESILGDLAAKAN